MARILTGIQSTGTPHLGNLLGAIIPAIKLSEDPKNESFFFIADMHSLTSIKDATFPYFSKIAEAPTITCNDKLSALWYAYKIWHF